MWLNSLAVFVFPGGEADITLAIAEELAHDFLIAAGDPSHAPDASSRTKERAAQAVMKRWGCDMSAYRKLVAWMKKRKIVVGCFCILGRPDGPRRSRL